DGDRPDVGDTRDGRKLQQIGRLHLHRQAVPQILVSEAFLEFDTGLGRGVPEGLAFLLQVLAIRVRVGGRCRGGEPLGQGGAGELDEPQVRSRGEDSGIPLADRPGAARIVLSGRSRGRPQEPGNCDAGYDDEQETYGVSHDSLPPEVEVKDAWTVQWPEQGCRQIDRRIYATIPGKVNDRSARA